MGFIQPRQYFQRQCDDVSSDPWDIPNCIDIWKPGEIVEVNNYYPFGLLHDYTATSQNAYQYKFLGQELQETGFYDMNARFYMPDLGIFGQHDPLSGKTLDPYGYAYQNPVFFTDPTGLEGDPIPGSSGTGNPQAIGTATSPIDVGEVILNASVKAVASNTLSIMPSNCLVCNGGGISAPRLQNTSTPSVPTQAPSESWYGLVGKGNWFFGTAGLLSGFAGSMHSRNMYSQGIRRGISRNYQLTGRNLSLFGKAAINNATRPISTFGKIGKGVGAGSFYLGVIFDGIGTLNYMDNPNSSNSVHPGKATLNTVFGVVGNWGGPIGASVGTIYFGVDNYYDGPQGQG
ncbi:RHS repeat-associated core domain protein-containing protein [Chryseobacterium sp. StRB126]|uniref:RHS repeat-associated core domain-containing protein n=1 Tax=Chryseobacterium sp. StRB126 TaxID=878220 RepID=UPI0004E99BFD|nr:RHS repeat-associated core domain-containing protein [Chryseobacterium sp. StRB126]BAP32514.1 RHS repeat-associated core domain protein-containing protein [Chryseobacterium sp. StRB126]